MLTTREIRHFHLFCGLGGGAKGFNKGSARVGNTVARFRCIGGIDVSPGAIRDFGRLAGVPGTVMDLFDRAQYVDFHGSEPPPGWREASPADIRAAAGGEYPNIIFLSPPCKGFSGLLAESKSRTAKYQALNRLTLRGMWLALEAFADDPVELILFENVPRAANRGRHLLDQICALLRHFGYAVAETTHDCGELGALAQSRKRFLLVARHAEKVPAFLYEPEKRNLTSVGTVLGRMPLPGDAAAGPMHRIPALQWKTWIRLAFVQAGSDWRSLNRLSVENGHLRDYLIMPEYRNGYLGVNRWDEPCGTVQGESRASNGAFSVADPRFNQSARWNDGQALGVLAWSDWSGAIAGQQSPAQGTYSVADPRIEGLRHNNVFRIVGWNDHAQAVTAGGHPTAGGQAVADPRPTGPLVGKYAVTRWNGASGTVIAGSAQGAYAVADPLRTATAADRPCLPNPKDKLTARIEALDGTWHRPFTTLELAALQSLIDPEEMLELDGLSDTEWRERIGNAVPPEAAEAIAGVMGTTLLLAWSGETFVLSSTPIWVRPIALGISMPDPELPQSLISR